MRSERRDRHERVSHRQLARSFGNASHHEQMLLIRVDCQEPRQHQRSNVQQIAIDGQYSLDQHVRVDFEVERDPCGLLGRHSLG